MLAVPSAQKRVEEFRGGGSSSVFKAGRSIGTEALRSARMWGPEGRGDLMGLGLDHAEAAAVSSFFGRTRHLKKGSAVDDLVKKAFIDCLDEERQLIYVKCISEAEKAVHTLDARPGRRRRRRRSGGTACCAWH